MIVRLQDNPRIIVKPETYPITVTGSTFYNFTGSGATTITETQTGNLVNVNVYSPDFTGDILQLESELTGLTSSFDSYTGTTAPNTFAPIIHTHSQYLTGVTWSIISDKPTFFSGDYDDLTNKPTLFTGNTFVASGGTVLDLTGDVLTIYSPTGGTGGGGTWGSITGTLSNQLDLQQALDGKSNTGHTHSQYLTGVTWNIISDKPTFFSGDYDDLSNKPDLSAFLTGVTWSIISDKPTFFSGDYDDLTNKPDLSVFLTGVTWNDVTLKPDLTLQSDFTGHTNNASIHFLMSEITGFTSTDTFNTYTGTTAPLQFLASNALDNYWNSGETQSYIQGLNYITGVTWGGITGSLSGQTDLQTALDLKLDNSVYSADMLIISAEIDALITGVTANTQSINSLDSAFNSHTGNTDIHFLMSEITGFTSTDTFNTYTGDTATALAGKSDTGHTHPQYLTGFTVTCDMVTGCTDGLYAPISHTHAISGVTGLQDALDGKSDTGHTHTGVYMPFDTAIVSVTGTTSLDSTHQNKIIEASGTFTITLPDSMPIGYRVDIVNVGTGTITLAASTTLQSDGTKLETQYTGASAYHRGSNVWCCLGRLTT